MGYVNTVKATRAQHKSLLQSGAVDPDTLYFVNDGNGWDDQSLDTEGDIFLGAKLLTHKPANPMDNPGGVFFVAVAASGSTAAAWAAALDGLTAYYQGLKVVVSNGTGAASGTTLTLNLNSLGARSVYRYGTTAISAIPSGGCALLTYVGTAASGKWVMDNYYTYDPATNYMRLFGCRASSVGVHAGSLCAFTSEGKLSSFKTTATGATVTTQWFRLGQPVFHSSAALAANATAAGRVALAVSQYNVDIRDSMCSYNYRRFHSGRQTDLYMAVEVDPDNGLYRPKKLDNASGGYMSGAAASYADHIATDLELAKGELYLYLGARYSTGETFYGFMLAAHNPLYYYDGSNLIPYVVWRANTLAADIASSARPLAVQETADWVQYGQANQSEWVEATHVEADIGGNGADALNLGSFQPGNLLKLTAGLTVANADDTAGRHVLFAVSLMIHKDGVTEVVERLASTMVSLPAAASKTHPHYASASLNVLRQLTADDVSRRCFMRIEAKEVSTQLGKTVRFCNRVVDFSGNEYLHASSFKATVWGRQGQPI